MKPLIAIILLFQTVTLKAQKEYVIEGYIKGIEDNTEISLLRNDGNILSHIAKDTIIAGKFRFSGKTEGPTSLAIVSRTPGFPSQWLDIYVAPSARIKITGSNKLLKTWTVESAIKDQIELSCYTKATRNELDKLQELSISRSVLFSTAGRKQVPGQDLVRVIWRKE